MSGWIRHACRGAIWLDRFVRSSYFGMTSMHLLLGAAAMSQAISPAVWLALTLAAMGFHAHIFLVNDVVDLEVDATQPRRRDYPLVRGLRGEGITRRAALGIAWAGLALHVAVAAWLEVELRAWLALLAAYVGIGIYNLWGKRFPVPPLTDVVQGLGWCGFVLFGALAVAPGVEPGALLTRLAPLLAYSMGFTLLITGVHGGLRDLVNDREHGRTNTSAFLGARAATPGEAQGSTTAVVSSPAVVVYAFAILLGMFAPMLPFFAAPGHFASALQHGAAGVLLGLLLVANLGMLWRVVKPREPKRDAWMSAHALVLLCPILLLYLVSSLPTAQARWIAAGFFWLPLLLQDRIAERLLAWLGSRERPEPTAAPSQGQSVLK